jgi:hypothetical protein
VGPWIVLGVGGAATAVGAALGISTLVDYQRLEGSCAPGCAPAEVDDLRRRALAGDVVVGIGIGAVVAGVVWLLAAPSSRPPASSAAGWRVGVGTVGGAF